MQTHTTLMKRTARILAIVPLAVCVGLVARVPAAHAMTPEQRTEQGVVKLETPSVNYYWSVKFGQYRLRYSAPRHVYYYDPGEGNTGCGSTTQYPNNSFYCAADHNIYLDLNWNQRELNAYGDGAAAFIYAHEWGHHIQYLDRWWAYEHGTNTRIELNADCEAGMYFRYGVRSGLMNAGDYQEARTWAYHHGGAPGSSHGTGLQRLQWFDYGYQTGSLPDCNRVFG